MLKWLTTFILILAFSASVITGMPTHSHSSNPAMMSCCKAAKGESTTQASMAKVCCAINCSEPAPTSGTANSINSQLSVAAVHPAAISPKTAPFHSPMRLEETRLQNSSQPKYICNLALLI